MQGHAIATSVRGPLHTDDEHLGAPLGKGHFEALAAYQT